MKTYDNILQLIGSTPLVRLNHLTEGIEAQVYVKLESLNPGGSVKDRIGVSMLEAAEREGRIKPGDLIIEPTSGNTGIGLALAARLKGYNCLFIMTDKASQERVRYLKALGADVLIVSSAAKMSSPEYYWNTAKRLSEELPNAIMLNQYDNPANPDIHEKTTGPEIWADTDGTITHFIAGIGTGGTISGTARFLRSRTRRSRSLLPIQLVQQSRPSKRRVDWLKHFPTSLKGLVKNVFLSISISMLLMRS
ncbi:MAG: cysteine synthase family protein [Ignavibacteria bacterium]|nr:cysteine synthase family protein [Ignavibacteria bacterium]